MNDVSFLPGMNRNYSWAIGDGALESMVRQRTATLYREKLAAEAENAAKSAFLAEMSHEIRTPLNALLGMLKLTQQTNLTAEQQEYLGLMQTAGASLLSVVNGILDWSRIEAGQLEIEHIAFSLRRNLDDSLQMLAGEARQKGLTLRCETDPAMPDALLGDPMRLRQVIVNLLGNAIKFSSHGEIVLHAVQQAGNPDDVSCQFTVSDQGIGIPAAQQAHIFRPYRQVDRSIARRYGGSGLGLSISAHLVDMMNGKIWLDSTPGQGSNFHFTACFGRQSGAEISPTTGVEATLQPATPATPLTILLVEDNATNRRLAQITLEKAGHQVMTADSGAAARALLKFRQPDLILMDVQMPEMDGLQTTAAIRQQEAQDGGHLPIIALTANALPTDRARCLAAGMDDYLAKPIEPMALLAIIAHLGGTLTRQGRPAQSDLVLDRPALLLQVNGDLHLLGEIRDLFLRDCGHLMAGVRQALAGRNAERFSQSVHTLRGMFSSLAAHTARELAGRLEHLSIDSALAESTYARLEHAVKALKTALIGMTQERKSSRPASGHCHSGPYPTRPRLRVQPIRNRPRRTWQGLPRIAIDQSNNQGANK